MLQDYAFPSVVKPRGMHVLVDCRVKRRGLSSDVNTPPESPRRKLSSRAPSRGEGTISTNPGGANEGSPHNTRVHVGYGPAWTNHRHREDTHTPRLVAKGAAIRCVDKENNLKVADRQLPAASCNLRDFVASNPPRNNGPKKVWVRRGAFALLSSIGRYATRTNP
jgi:hypothetical protein